jgi:GT2 family glycosyltransferase
MNEESYPSIDIVILNYNGHGHLQKTLPVLSSLSYPNYKIIVVDNNSEDESKGYIRRFPEITLIENSKNLGYSKGKNIGVEQTTAQFVLLLDNDILLKDNDILLKLVRFYTSCREKPGFISIPFIDLNEDTTEYYGLYTNARKEHVPIQKILDKEPFEIPCPMGGLLFFKKEVWDDIDGFDDTLPYSVDDWDIGVRSCILGYHNFLFPSSYAVHLSGSRVHQKNYPWKYRYELAGFMYTITKSYTAKSLIKWYILGYLYYVYKTLRNTLRRKSLLVIFSFIVSHFILLKSLPSAIAQRKQIQKKRRVKEDLFLNLRPPKLK